MLRVHPILCFSQLPHTGMTPRIVVGTFRVLQATVGDYLVIWLFLSVHRAFVVLMY